MTDTPNTNSPHARNFAQISPEDTAALLTIAQRLGIAYEMAPHTEAVMPQDREFDFSQFHKERDGLFAFVNTLLATRAAEIECLQACQITDEMNRIYTAHLDGVAEWADDPHYDFSFKTDNSLKEDLWIEFLKIMEGRKS